MDIRLIALDLDGTVFDDKKNISPRTLAAMQAALDKGIAVVPATGRTVDGVPTQFLYLPGVRYALTSNGATVADLQTGETLVSQCFDPRQAAELYDLLEPFGGQFSLFLDGKSYSTRAGLEDSMQFVPENLREYIRSSRIIVEDMQQAIRDHADRVEKFSILYPTLAVRDAAWQAVAERFPDMEITTSLACNLEVNAPGVSKGTGLLALARVLGLTPAQVMACGDSGNDLTMIELAGLGVAMGNATEPVKAAAKVVTQDNNHDGVALAIEKYAL